MTSPQNKIADIQRKQAAATHTLQEEIALLKKIEAGLAGLPPDAIEALQLILGRPRVSSRFDYHHAKTLTLIQDFLYTGETLGDELMYAEGARGTIQFLKDVQSGKVRERMEEQLSGISG